MALIIGSHLLISKIVYYYVLEQMNFKLDKHAFMYGNIKPDIKSEEIRYKHKFNDSIYYINAYCHKAMKEPMSKKDFSTALGVICHFVADYFCIYHSEKYCHKSIFKHLLYEIGLHLKLITLLLIGKLKPLIRNFNNKKIIIILLEMRSKYNKEEDSFEKDIIYSVSTAALVAKAIIASSEVYLNEKDEKGLCQYKLQKVEGGSL
jgi:hypothetical protein